MYSFSTTIIGDYESVKGRTIAALQDQGFGVLTEIDVKATMKKKLDKDLRPYIILGACNPALAYQAVTAESDIGLLLPCNVVVREEENGQITVAFMDPQAVLSLVGKPEIESMAEEVRNKLQKVMAAI